MSTAASPTAPSFTKENFNLAYGMQTKGDKKEAVVISTENAETLDKEGKFEGNVVDFAVTYPATFDDFVAWVNQPQKDDDGNDRDISDVKTEALRNFVNGSKSKVMNRARALIGKTDDKGNLTYVLTGGVVDLTSEILSGSKRVFLSEDQKTWNGLKHLPEAMKDNIWRAYLSATGKDYYIPTE